VWAQVITGQELDIDGLVRPLDAGAWEQRRGQLQQAGE
jgi:hypothetical protein